MYDNKKRWSPSTVVGYHRLYLVNIDCCWFPFSIDGVCETRKEGTRKVGRRDDECLMCRASRSKRNKAK